MHARGPGFYPYHKTLLVPTNNVPTTLLSVMSVYKLELDRTGGSTAQTWTSFDKNLASRGISAEGLTH